ncbi:MAG: R3H domain-containing nucleic acid-binding protein [Candidatus Faecisoma sp.]|jgi:spoIIIJ-associated protein|nr:KH domain-containing protein [Acholeplasma sp.]MCI5677326.1 KH domain-containing protein [Acholeplasma sp.]MDY2893114.1 R3H domain-containing nucleic acid-binding protein [Candidatus Faecisoma sp.]CCY27739.1 r3H domain protein [Acholeplasma sp. CAG:878]
MITSYKYEGKNNEELLIDALTELKVTRDDVYFKQTTEEGKLFKAKKYIIEIIKKEDVINYIKKYINEFANKFGVKINSEVRESDGIINVMLVTENNALLIGKDGKNIDAIQILLRQAVCNQTNQNIKVLVDISGYKNKKNKNLEFEIKKICKEVLNTKVEVKLDPMNSYQRRIVHTVVSEFPNLKSESIGEAPNRYTVISYKE